MRSLLCLALLSAGAASAPVTAQAEESPPELVRLPGEGEVKQPARPGGPRDRLLPGGGLFMSFDADRNGEVSRAEIEAGISKAFETADTDGNGVLTALEQQAWAEDLPTRDDTLANPVRFDPNLDRRVSPEEFADVILELARDYSGDGSGTVMIAALKAPEKREQARATAERRRPDYAERRRPSGS